MDPCTNASCSQYRIQHRIISAKRNELENEVERLRRDYAQLQERIVMQGVAAAAREDERGDEASLLMPSGERITAEKFTKQRHMFKTCMESLQVISNVNWSLYDSSLHH
jgi:F0F1-type ATP synthase beta subunit